MLKVYFTNKPYILDFISHTENEKQHTLRPYMANHITFWNL
ncbi:hypothetical protein OIU77_021991 [Salix suchowensis]|uniref:Uncharacterized protein n=1 Tax=Salix suchowensis TaxID=1278906 RepID=A0ABQ9CFW4_9ROSI|nr:hypothetical protein OIU77_021991 [Salix suchowensis]